MTQFWLAVDREERGRSHCLNEHLTLLVVFVNNGPVAN